MKSFVLFSSREESHSITEKEFEKWTKGEFPFVQKDSEKTRYYATCPECENPIQIRGLYGNSKKYGAHAGKDVDGLNPFNYENYIYCPRSVQGRRIPKETRKKTTSPKDITIYNVIRDNFDLIIEFAKKHLGYYISDDSAKECLRYYYALEGWLYPHSTVNNIPFILFYIQSGFNPYGLWIRKGSLLEKAILKSKDLKLEIVDGKAGAYYSKLLPNSKKFMALTMMVWSHEFAENENGELHESVNLQICKNISDDPERYKWEELVEQKIEIPEAEFVKFINSSHKYRNEELVEYARQLMPPLELDQNGQES